MAVYDLTYNIGPGDLQLFLPNNYENSQSDYYILAGGGPVPPNVLLVFQPNGPQFTWAVLSGGTLGTYVFTIEHYDVSVLVDTFNVTLNITANAITTDCCITNKTLVWLNRAGGISSYLFSEKNSLKVEQKSTGEYKTFERELRHISKSDVYDGVVIAQSGVPVDHDEIIKSLRLSIQAWEQKGKKLVPIILNADSFVYRPREQGLFDVDFEYRYSTEIIIQNH